MKFSFPFLLFLVAFPLFSFAQLEQKQSPENWAETITAWDLEKHLTIIASDEMEGRETGTAGIDKAATYISNFLKSIGLSAVGENNSYYQGVTITWSAWKDVDLKINGKEFQHKKDFVGFPARNSNLEKIEIEEVLFLGYGIDHEQYSDYKGVDVEGKVLLIYDSEPLKKNGVSRITQTKERSEWSTDWTKKLKVAHQKGVKAVLIINHQVGKMVSESLQFINGRQMILGTDQLPKDNFANSLYISTNMAKEIMGSKKKKVLKARKKIQKKGRPRAISLPVSLELTQTKDERQLIGKNILGFIEGSDPTLKKEIVVVSAHYDHLGKKGPGIYNGADDNGSGTSTILEVAEAFSMAKAKGAGAKRSVLFVWLTGEEKGLLGSKYYVNHPLFPLEQTIVDINVDMVGRVDAKYKNNPNYIYVIGSDRLSSDLHRINEEVNQKYTQLTLDYTYNEEDDPNRYYYRSDHYNFAEKGIPAIFYFNGTHPDYHRTTDTVEKINFEKMETIGRLVFHTAWNIANRAERIKVDRGRP